MVGDSTPPGIRNRPLTDCPIEKPRPTSSLPAGTVLLPAATIVSLAMVLTAWSVKEYRTARDEVLKELRQTAADAAVTVTNLTWGKSRRGRLSRARGRSILHAVLRNTDLTFAHIRFRNGGAIQAGQAPNPPPPAGAPGMEQWTPEFFLSWHRVDPPAGSPPRRNGTAPNADGDAIELHSDDLLLLALPVAAYQRRMVPVRTRLARVLMLTAAGLGLLGGVWHVALRNRNLQMQLAAARTHAEHLEEFGLAAAGLAHETRNPLGIVRGLAQQITRTPEAPPESREMAETIVEEVDTAISRLGHFMAYAKMREPQTAPTDLRAVVERLEQMLQPDFEAADVTFEATIPDCRIIADSTMLQQVLINLLLNARQACDPGGHVTLSATHDERTATITVADTGHGIPPELADDLFKPYVTGRADGQGLGLAMVRRIAEAHGWRIAVNSPTDRGALFRIDDIALA